jgi:hypothetical protein
MQIKTRRLQVSSKFKLKPTIINPDDFGIVKTCSSWFKHEKKNKKSIVNVLMQIKRRLQVTYAG